MARPLLIFLNEVAGGRRLLRAARQRAASASEVIVAAPVNRPQVGQLSGSEDNRRAARERVEITLEVLSQFGIEARGELLDPEPDLALGDAIREHRPAEALVSCLPEARYGLTRRDLVGGAQREFEPGTLVTRIPVRIEQDSKRLDVTHTLVVANQTLDSDDLYDRLLELAEAAPRRFTIIAPGTTSDPDVIGRLATLMAQLYRADIDATGQPMEADAFTAVTRAIDHYRVDDVLVSTLSAGESGWLERDLIGRIRETNDRPVTHHEAGRPPETVVSSVAHGEPADVQPSPNAEGSEA